MRVGRSRAGARIAPPTIPQHGICFAPVPNVELALGIVVCAGLVGPAGAHDDPRQPEYNAMLDACYKDAEGPAGRSACKGIVSGACMEQPDGQTTLGMSMCAQVETDAWDEILNDEYRQTMAWAKAMDAEDQHHFPEFANRETGLRDAQRAWLKFREAECGLDYAVWGAGSMRHIAGSACYADMTADRTIRLRDIRETMR